MKRLLLFAIFCFFILLCGSCKSASQKYVDNYVSFAEDFLCGYENYSTYDWDEALEKYERLRNDYNTYMSDMTCEQRQIVDEYNGKINAAIIRYEVGNTTTQIESLFNEAIGTLNELFK